MLYKSWIYVVSYCHISWLVWFLSRVILFLPQILEATKYCVSVIFPIIISHLIFVLIWCFIFIYIFNLKVLFHLWALNQFVLQLIRRCLVLIKIWYNRHSFHGTVHLIACTISQCISVCACSFSWKSNVNNLECLSWRMIRWKSFFGKEMGKEINTCVVIIR